MKPWNKLNSIMEAQHITNQKFVNFFIENRHVEANREEDHTMPVKKQATISFKGNSPTKSVKKQGGLLSLFSGESPLIKENVEK